MSLTMRFIHSEFWLNPCAQPVPKSGLITGLVRKRKRNEIGCVVRRGKTTAVPASIHQHMVDHVIMVLVWQKEIGWPGVTEQFYTDFFHLFIWSDCQALSLLILSLNTAQSTIKAGRFVFFTLTNQDILKYTVGQKKVIVSHQLCKFSHLDERGL